MVSLTLLTQSTVADWILKQLVIFLNIVSTINESSLTSCDTSVVKLLLNGDKSLDLETNTLILNATVDFILSSGRFDGPLI